MRVCETATPAVVLACVSIALGLGAGCGGGAAATEPTPSRGSTDGSADGAGPWGGAGSCGDGVENGDETDVDCGGGCARKCGAGKGCETAADCDSGMCSANVCQSPSTCSDNLENGSESDVDCGGGCPKKCADGKQCVTASDCESGVCMDAKVCAAPSCTDTVKNGTESDADCGGGCPDPCSDGEGCVLPADCESGVCKANQCQAPACPDGVKQGMEACDGNDVGEATCGSTVAPGWIGKVGCTAQCALDASTCVTPATTYNALSAAHWSTHDVSTLNPKAKGFIGGAFDGRYLYLTPYAHGVVSRYDTQAKFDSASSWLHFDVWTATPGQPKFESSAFDGRYLYLVATYDTNVPPNITYSGLVARYDTQAPFDAAASWTSFDVATVNAGARGFQGAVFDGRYLYLVPNANMLVPLTYAGLVARFDTQAPFHAAASWSTFDVATVNPAAKGFHGGTFDGRYIYFAPTINKYPPYTLHGTVTRYDTQAPFNAAASWSTFDVTTVHPAAKGFHGAAFDGKYVYLVPQWGDVDPSGLVARHDTQAPFTSASSWSTFDVTTINAAAKGFTGAAFDGKYLYLAPYGDDKGNAYGTIARLDTQAQFSSASSWSTFDVTTVNAGAKGFQKAVFDGRFLYLVPFGNAINTYDGIVARFDAKSPFWLPKGWHVSFF
jgi:hypothetical protein